MQKSQIEVLEKETDALESNNNLLREEVDFLHEQVDFLESLHNIKRMYWKNKKKSMNPNTYIFKFQGIT